MSTTVEQDVVGSLEEAGQSLARRIKGILESRDATIAASDDTAFVRLQVPVKPLSPLAWLHVQKSHSKIYWSRRDDEFEMAGIGAADIVVGKNETDDGTVLSHVSQRLKGCSDDLRYYGGLRFGGKKANSPDRLWNGFGNSRFVIPRFELCRHAETTHFVCNVAVSKDKPDTDKILAELGDVVPTTEQPGAQIPSLVNRVDNPGESQWQAMVKSALESFEREILQKLVLARQTTLEFSQAIDPLVFLRKLKTSTPHCYHLCFQFGDATQPRVAFIGASPERLYRRSGRRITSEAVAGTRPRGRSEEEDALLERELLDSDKELREQRYVVQGLTEALEQLCRALHHDSGVSLMKLVRLQHLITRFEGELRAGVSDEEILTAMHPTPAVGGYPVTEAVRQVIETEPFDRGWYAGPVGWLGNDAAEFAVGIRSGLVADERLHLYAGAGIVAGSTPESEWHETENKIRNFIAALTER